MREETPPVLERAAESAIEPDLEPLLHFYGESGQGAPRFQFIPGEEVPEPYRELLVHDRDMTPTLERFHGERIHLRPLEREEADGKFMRMVVLTTSFSRQPVEYGAIAIHLDRFSERAQELIRGCRTPLGTILATEDIQHVSRPTAFFRVHSDARMEEALGLYEPWDLYGRRSALWTPEGVVLADVVEILPP